MPDGVPQYASVHALGDKTPEAIDVSAAESADLRARPRHGPSGGFTASRRRCHEVVEVLSDCHLQAARHAAEYAPPPSIYLLAGRSAQVLTPR